MKKNESKPVEPNKASAVEKEPTVSVFIPAEGNGAFLEGALNGVNFRIPTDRIVEIPERIARIVKESRKGLTDGAHAVAAFAESGGRKIG